MFLEVGRGCLDFKGLVLCPAETVSWCWDWPAGRAHRQALTVAADMLAHGSSALKVPSTLVRDANAIYFPFLWRTGLCSGGWEPELMNQGGSSPVLCACWVTPIASLSRHTAPFRFHWLKSWSHHCEYSLCGRRTSGLLVLLALLFPEVVFMASWGGRQNKWVFAEFADEKWEAQEEHGQGRD